MAQFLMIRLLFLPTNIYPRNAGLTDAALNLYVHSEAGYGAGGGGGGSAGGGGGGVLLMTFTFLL